MECIRSYNTWDVVWLVLKVEDLSSAIERRDTMNGSSQRNGLGSLWLIQAPNQQRFVRFGILYFRPHLMHHSSIVL